MRTLLLFFTLSLAHPAPSLNARTAADTTAPITEKHRKPLYEKGHGTPRNPHWHIQGIPVI